MVMTPSRRPAPRAWAPYLVATCAMLFAVLAWRYVSRSAETNDQLRAAAEAQRVVDAITDRINGQIGLLRACAGFFAANDEVTRDEFRRMVEHLELPRYYPGTVSIGFSLRIEAEAQDELVQRMRGDLPDFQVWPDSDAGGPGADAQAAEVHSIVYLEPLNEFNQLAIGFNMMTEEVRREAMERARDNGEAAASGQVRLVLDAMPAGGAGSPTGFLMFVPVYRGGIVPATIESRREQLVGFVYSQMRPEVLLAQALHIERDRLLDMIVYDGERFAPSDLMHDSRQASVEEASIAGQVAIEPRLHVQRHMLIAGRPWAIDFATRPAFDEASERRLARYILITGVVISVLLLLVSLAQRRAAQDAERITQQVRQSQASLRESEQRFRATFNQAAAGMAQIDVDGRFLSVNQRLCDITGYSDDELLGMTFLDITHPEDRATEQEHMRQMLEARIDMFSLAKRYIRRDGRVVWVNLSRSAVRDADGRMRYCIGVVEDITERRRAEEELERHRDLLESLVAERTAELETSHQRLRQTERIAALGTLSTGLGHDMGNLLLPIRLRLAAMQSKGLPVEFNDDVDAIRKSSEYLQQLANGLRLLALNPEDDRASAQATDLSLWWNDAQPLLRNALPRGVTLESDLPASAPGARLASHLLTQVVFNLVQNAGDALRNAGMTERGQVRVWVRHTAGAANITLGVSDNGPGMTEDVRRRCLEPFFTTKTRGIATGMGLALVHGIVQRAGGTIDIRSGCADHSAGASGTTFHITLPAATISAAADKVGHGLLGAGHRSHAGVALKSPRYGAGGGTESGESSSCAEAVVTLSDSRRRAYLISVLRSLGFDARADEAPSKSETGLWVLEAIDAESGYLADGINGDGRTARSEATPATPVGVPCAALQYVHGHAGRRALVFVPTEDPTTQQAPERIVLLSPLAKPTAIWQAAREVARELSV